MRPAQIFSVYNYDEGIYRYYAAPLGDVPASGFYRPARNALPEGMAAALPVGAQPIGEGQTPQGVIATDGAVSSGPSLLTVKNVAILASTGFALWRVHRWLMRKGRRR